MRARALEQTLCLEVLFITVFMWAAIWGAVDLLAQRLASDAERGALYAGLFAGAVVLIWATPGLTTCRGL